MVSDNLLTFAAGNYGFDKTTLHFISESTNQIYIVGQSIERFLAIQDPDVHEVPADMQV